MFFRYPGGPHDHKKFDAWKSRLEYKHMSNYDKNSAPQGVSTANDTRLENTIEMAVELRLKVFNFSSSVLALIYLS